MIENRMQFRVRYVETDQMGIAHHSNYFAWFECGRAELMRDLGYTYAEMEKEGILMPLPKCTANTFALRTTTTC